MWPFRRSPATPDPAWDRGQPDGWLDVPGGEPVPIHLNDDIRPGLEAEWDQLPEDAAMRMAFHQSQIKALYEKEPYDDVLFYGVEVAEEQDIHGYVAAHEGRRQADREAKEAVAQMHGLKPWQSKAIHFLDRAHAALERGIVRLK